MIDGYADYGRLAENREAMYGFLARSYCAEIDRGLLDDMRALSFPEEVAEGSYAKGIRLLTSYLADPGFNAVTDLAVDYARVFLAAGIADGKAAFPYESVYTSPERLIMQDARDKVVSIYRAQGLDVADGTTDPEDHLAFELEFMAHLCRMSREAFANGDEAAVSACVREQADFVELHLLNWVPAFCTDVETYAQTEFYQAIAKMTRGYLELDCAFLISLLANEA